MPEADAVSLAALQKLNDSGYGYYRQESRQRADDLFVRSRAADALCRAAARVAETAAAARRAIPHATRETPYPDPALLAHITALRNAQTRLAALETRLRGPAALPDRDFSRLRASPAHCARLVALDAALLDITESDAPESRLADLEKTLEARAALATWNPT